MGSVFKIDDEEKYLCVKRVIVEYDFIQSECQNEFDVLQRLDHPVIVKMHRIFF